MDADQHSSITSMLPVDVPDGGENIIRPASANYQPSVWGDYFIVDQQFPPSNVEVFILVDPLIYFLRTSYSVVLGVRAGISTSSMNTCIMMTCETICTCVRSNFSLNVLLVWAF